jgi:hypothetical protein
MQTEGLLAPLVHMLPHLYAMRAAWKRGHCSPTVVHRSAKHEHTHPRRLHFSSQFLSAPVRHACCLEARPLLADHSLAELLGRKPAAAAACCCCCCCGLLLKGFVVLPDELQRVGGDYNGSLVSAPAAASSRVAVHSQAETADS